MFGSRNFLFAKASAIVAQFKLFTWGTNTNFGELGLGDKVNRSSPVQVGSLVDWGTPAAGKYFSLCTKTNGTLWSWGRGTYGNLGKGNTTYYSSPVQVGALTSWEKPSAGTNSSACIRTDGTLWAWGKNNQGQLGQNNVAYRSSPVQVGSSTTWLANSVGQEFMLAVDNGKLFSWGSNDTGQLGLGDTADRSSPVQVGALTNWATPTVGGSHALCTKTDGTLWSWGANNYGQLGILVYPASRSSPVQIGGLTNWINPAAGTTFSVCTTIDGKIWSWGNGGNGYLGLGNTASRSSPVQIGSLTPWTKVSAGRRQVEALQGVETTAPVNLTVPVVTGTAIEGRTLVSTYGTWDNYPSSFAFQWQRNTSNISGATSNTYLVDAADVGSTLRCVVTATNSFGSASANSANTATVTAFTGGQLWTWGEGNHGGLGLGNTVDRSSPVQVGSDATWTKVFGGQYRTFAINAATELYAWGLQANNAFFGGALGIGAQYSRSSPVQVGGTGWANVASTGDSYGVSAFIKTDGTLWTTGNSNKGQLGQYGGTTNSPVQVGALTAWKEIAASFSGFMSIKTDGTLWAWGYNNQGQLGLGNTTTYSSPVQVGNLTNWKIISGAATSNSVANRFQAVKTDGTLWGWGGNTNGTLGTGNSTNFSSPVQIGALTTWSNINIGSGTSGGGGQAVARKTDGSLWVWGVGGDGALGLGNTSNYNSPVQLIGPNNWLNSIACVGFNQCTIVRSDGTLTTWGLNTPAGQLGLGDTAGRSRPTQVGALTTWRTTKISPWGVVNAGIKIP